MCFVQWGRGRGEQVAGGFADVYESCGLGVADVGPEGAGGEGFADGKGDAAEEVGEGGDAAGSVVERHAVVPAIASGAGGLAEEGAAVG